MCLLSARKISFFLCLLLIHQFMGSPIEHPAAVNEFHQPGLEETADFIDLTDAVIGANSRARRQQSTMPHCSPNLRPSTDREYHKKIAMSDSGDVSVVSSNCTKDTIVELYGVRPGLVRFRFQSGYLGVTGTNVSAHNITNPSYIKLNDNCLWCETGNSEQGFRFRYYSPSMNVCTDEQAPELYLAVTATDDVIVSASCFRNMSTFSKECDNWCS